MVKINIYQNNNYTKLLENIGYNEIFDWECEYCGEKHSDEKRNFLRRQRKCSCQKIKEKIDKINKELLKVNFIFLYKEKDSYVKTSTKNVDTKKPILVKCLKCGKISYEYYDNIRTGHKKCNCNEEKNFTRNISTEDFIKKWHYLNQKNFSLVQGETYINRNSKYKIRCNNCGKEDVRWGLSLIDGPIKCKYCNIGSKNEQLIGFFLDSLGIEYIREYPISINNNNYRFDFFLPNNNIVIEYNGEQHYKAYEHFGGEEKLKKTQLSDKTKKQYCIENNLELVIFNYQQNEEDIKKQLGLMFNDYPERE